MKQYVLFKHPYVLIEDSRGKYRPIHKEYIKTVPSLNLNSPPLCCPFSSATRNKSQTKRAGLPKAGYCEICYTKFDDYTEHVNLNEHLEYAVDFNNYKEVDAFILEFERRQEIDSEIILRSPCDKLEAELANSNALYYSSGNIIQMSIEMTEESMPALNRVIITDIENYNGQINK